MRRQKDGRGRDSGLRRREFLILSSAGAVGIATSGLASDLARVTGLAPGVPRPYTIGFAPILPAAAPDAGRQVAPVVPADSLRSGHAAFAGASARVTVHGFWRAAHQRHEPVSVGLSAFFPLTDGTLAPLLAWSHTVPQTASLTVPVSDDGTLTLDFQMRDPLPAPALYGVSRRFTDVIRGAANATDTLLSAPAETRCRLAIGNAAGAPKLQRGTYVVAFRRDALAALPVWSSLRVTTENGRIARAGSPLQRATALGLEPAADVDYILFSVDALKA